ncbi:MAG: type II toxin-antitoxin system RelB/DinJ family antitoxin [Defluviitaleaceae bacterium]|nr:type II toxin-antitoxin system RelB/DinJ family antitoxin [Defluviitaleaceae bacterium]
MTKTIQVRVDNQFKEAVDTLFTSLGMDTSTAIRIFLNAAMEAGGIPFAVTHRADRDTAIMEAIERRRAGVQFVTAEQSLENMKNAIKGVSV